MNGVTRREWKRGGRSGGMDHRRRRNRGRGTAAHSYSQNSGILHLVQGLNMVNMEALPPGLPLESPLRERRSRTLNSSSPSPMDLTLSQDFEVPPPSLPMRTMEMTGQHEETWQPHTEADDPPLCPPFLPFPEMMTWRVPMQGGSALVEDNRRNSGRGRRRAAHLYSRDVRIFHPAAVDRLDIVNIEDLPVGSPLESPLHEKRRRRIPSPSIPIYRAPPSPPSLLSDMEMAALLKGTWQPHAQADEPPHCPPFSSFPGMLSGGRVNDTRPRGGWSGGSAPFVPEDDVRRRGPSRGRAALSYSREARRFHPAALDRLNMVNIEDLPVGLPLESPLYESRRRRTPSPSRPFYFPAPPPPPLNDMEMAGLLDGTWQPRSQADVPQLCPPFPPFPGMGVPMRGGWRGGSAQVMMQDNMRRRGRGRGRATHSNSQAARFHPVALDQLNLPVGLPLESSLHGKRRRRSPSESRPFHPDVPVAPAQPPPRIRVKRTCDLLESSSRPCAEADAPTTPPACPQSPEIVATRPLHSDVSTAPAQAPPRIRVKRTCELLESSSQPRVEADAPTPPACPQSPEMLIVVKTKAIPGGQILESLLNEKRECRSPSESRPFHPAVSTIAEPSPPSPPMKIEESSCQLENTSQTRVESDALPLSPASPPSPEMLNFVNTDDLTAEELESHLHEKRKCRSPSAPTPFHSAVSTIAESPPPSPPKKVERVFDLLDNTSQLHAESDATSSSPSCSPSPKMLNFVKTDDLPVDEPLESHLHEERKCRSTSASTSFHSTVSTIVEPPSPPMKVKETSNQLESTSQPHAESDAPSLPPACPPSPEILIVVQTDAIPVGQLLESLLDEKRRGRSSTAPPPPSPPMQQGTSGQLESTSQLLTETTAPSLSPGCPRSPGIMKRRVRTRGGKSGGSECDNERGRGRGRAARSVSWAPQIIHSVDGSTSRPFNLDVSPALTPPLPSPPMKVKETPSRLESTPQPRAAPDTPPLSPACPLSAGNVRERVRTRGGRSIGSAVRVLENNGRGRGRGRASRSVSWASQIIHSVDGSTFDQAVSTAPASPPPSSSTQLKGPSSLFDATSQPRTGTDAPSLSPAYTSSPGIMKKRVRTRGGMSGGSAQVVVEDTERGRGRGKTARSVSWAPQIINSVDGSPFDQTVSTGPGSPLPSPPTQLKGASGLLEDTSQPRTEVDAPSLFPACSSSSGIVRRRVRTRGGRSGGSAQDVVSSVSRAPQIIHSVDGMRRRVRTRGGRNGASAQVVVEDNRRGRDRGRAAHSFSSVSQTIDSGDGTTSRSFDQTVSSAPASPPPSTTTQLKGFSGLLESTSQPHTKTDAPSLSPTCPSCPLSPGILRRGVRTRGGTSGGSTQVVVDDNRRGSGRGRTDLSDSRTPEVLPAVGVRKRVRTRGGRSGGSAQVVVEDNVLGRGGGRPVLSDSAAPEILHAVGLKNVEVEALPHSLPLESPLQKKRGVTWSQSDFAVLVAPAPAPTTPPIKVIGIKVLFDDTSQPHTETDAPPQSPACSPSPEMLVDSGTDSSCQSSPLNTPTKRARLRQTLRDYSKINYGSEPESESDGEEMVAPVLSRTFRIAVELPETEDLTSPTNSSCSAANDSTTTGEEVQHPNFYDFRWTAFPDPQISPELRREKFSANNVGPTTPYFDPYDTFTAIWDRQFMEHIASETNRYAQEVAQQRLSNHSLRPSSRICDWRDTSASELYVFFAIILAMGTVVKSKIQDYWSTNPDIFYTPGFSAQMPLRRFQLINKCLHFNNNQDLCALELDASKAKLFKIQPVLSHLNNKFQAMYNMRQNIALDESLLQWKGWLDINQFISNKAASVGIKTYEVCESQTGYLWRFEVHAHKHSSVQQSRDPLDAFTPTIVLRLIQGLENKGHTLWMDNFYNSPVLARKLKTLGFDCVGTLRTNRQFVPEALNNLTKENMTPGQITGFTSGDVDLMLWRDQNRVAMISTYHGSTVTYVDGRPKPTLIVDYNVMMGGVDKKDQMLAMYPIERKRTKIWYKKFFRRLLNVSVLNAYILVKQSSSSTFSHRSFRTSLVKSILEKHSARVVPAIPPHKLFEVKHHHLMEYPFLPGNSGRLRRVCTHCKKRVQTYCVGCNKALCMSPCFISSHS